MRTMTVRIEHSWGTQECVLEFPEEANGYMLLEDWVLQAGPRNDMGWPVWRMDIHQAGATLRMAPGDYGCAGIDDWLAQRGATLKEVL